MKGLKTKDHSPQGFYDKDIIDLINLVNSTKEYKTTSSCSGRITLMRGSKKSESEWVFKNHSETDYKEVLKFLGSEYLRFLYEPLILHIKCKSFESASRLFDLLQRNGFKKSYIFSIKNNIIEINDTGKMETLVNNKLPEEYIKDLVNEANKRLRKTKENIKKLEDLFGQKPNQNNQDNKKNNYSCNPVN